VALVREDIVIANSQQERTFRKSLQEAAGWKVAEEELVSSLPRSGKNLSKQVAPQSLDSDPPR
jgi:hypothetical protein